MTRDIALDSKIDGVTNNWFYRLIKQQLGKIFRALIIIRYNH